MTIIQLPQTPYSAGTYRILVNGQLEEFPDFTDVNYRIEELVANGALIEGEAA